MCEFKILGPPLLHLAAHQRQGNPSGNQLVPPWGPATHLKIPITSQERARQVIVIPKRSRAQFLGQTHKHKNKVGKKPERRKVNQQDLPKPKTKMQILDVVMGCAKNQSIEIHLFIGELLFKWTFNHFLSHYVTNNLFMKV